jgi:hypothetical protein
MLPGSPPGRSVRMFFVPGFSYPLPPGGHPAPAGCRKNENTGRPCLVLYVRLMMHRRFSSPSVVFNAGAAVVSLSLRVRFGSVHLVWYEEALGRKRPGSVRFTRLVSFFWNLMSVLMHVVFCHGSSKVHLQGSGKHIHHVTKIRARGWCECGAWCS